MHATSHSLTAMQQPQHRREQLLLRRARRARGPLRVIGFRCVYFTYHYGTQRQGAR